MGRSGSESTPGEGSAFHFTAAFGVPEASAAGDSLLSAVRGRVARIETSNPTRRKFLEEQLATWGLGTVYDGSAETFDFLILDVDPETLAACLPGKGKDACPALGVIVLFDQWSNGDMGAMGLTVPVKRLIKPVSSRELLAALADLTQPDPHTDVPTSKALPEALAPLRVLLVEDNPVNQKVARLMLQRLKHRVQTADDGQRAVELVRAEEFDAVLMDMQMPVMDGYEATRLIRRMETNGELPGRDHLPIIAMTAHAMAGDRETCLQAGMDDYISKPIDSASLRKILEKHRPAAVTACTLASSPLQ